MALRKYLAVACFVLLFASGFAAVTVDKAGQIAYNYMDKGESVNLQPQAKTYVGTDEFWVMELTYLNKIIVMIPIRVDDGTVVSDDSILPALKTHYLANYFATDDTIASSLDSTLNYAQAKKTAYQNALNNFDRQQPIPGNASIQTYGPLRDALAQAIADDDNLRTNKIIPAQNAISAISTDMDIDTAKAALDSVFAAEDTFYKDVGAVSTRANAFVAELANSPKMGSSNLGLAYSQIANNLPEDITKKTDALLQNTNTINAFFSGLNTKAGDFLVKLQNRVNASGADAARQAVFNRLQNITNQANNITSNAASIPADYQEKITALTTLLNQTQQAYTDGNYDQAAANFDKLDADVAELLPLIGTAGTECTGGKVWNGAACVCPQGTKEQSGICTAASQGSTFNWPLILGAGAVVVVLVLLLLKRKKAPEEPQAGTEGQWQSYGWNKT